MNILCLITLLLASIASCEKKVQFVDTQHDRTINLNSRISKKETTATREILQTDESKYSSNTEVDQLQHQQQSYYGTTASSQELDNQVGDYAELQPYESFKFVNQQDATRADFNQETYLANDATLPYAKQNNQLKNTLYQQDQHHMQNELPYSQNEYDLLEQQRYRQQQAVLVGNQLQSDLQKAAQQKYVNGNEEKGNYYTHNSNGQLLKYLKTYQVNPTEHQNEEHQNTGRKYLPELGSTQVHSAMDSTYLLEPQYYTNYPKQKEGPNQPMHNGAPMKATVVPPLNYAYRQQHYVPASMEIDDYPIYETSHGSQKNSPAVPQSSQYIDLRHQQQEQQQQQQFVIRNSQSSNADSYNTQAATYAQDNTLDKQQQQHYQMQQQYYVPIALVEQIMTQLLEQAGIKSATGEGVQVRVESSRSEEPLHHFTPPYNEAQKFRDSHAGKDLVPVSGKYEGFPQKSAYSSMSLSSRPRTLLDSYVPSRVIAAQDANRYKERPIKLEGGFLPSKMDFRYFKKRTTEEATNSTNG